MNYSSKILSYHIGKMDNLNVFMSTWINGHFQDHQTLFSGLNGLEVALKNSPYKINNLYMFFNSKDKASLNKFLYYDNFQHNSFYQWLNKLGAKLIDYNKPPMVTHPLLNPFQVAVGTERGFYNNFIYAEHATHTMLLKALNLLFNAYGVK